MTDEKHPSIRHCLLELATSQAAAKEKLDSHIVIYNRDQKAYIASQLQEHQDHAEINATLAEIKAAVTRTKDRFTGWIIAALTFLMVTMAGATVGLVIYIVKTLHPA